MYVSFVCGVVTSAWYTMLRVLQFPSSGQVFFLRQLQLLSIWSDCFDGLLIWALLWLEIMVCFLLLCFCVSVWRLLFFRDVSGVDVLKDRRTTTPYPRVLCTLPSFSPVKRPRWRPVGLNDRHLRSHGKIGDCEQSTMNKSISDNNLLW